MANDRPLTSTIRPGLEPMTIEEYEKAGGYEGLKKAVKTMQPSEVTQAVKDAGLRGRGGAGFSTGLKWSFVPMGEKAVHPKYFIVNADEMEPGTFKDRFLMEGSPHQLVEGLIIASYAIEADIAYIFIRGHYRLARQRLEKAIAEARERGYLGNNILGSGYSLDMRIHVSAGRYICGEETALISALEGRRAIPRTRPPFPAVSGLFGKPTAVNNVETICNVSHIVKNGVDWYKSISKSEDGGTKIYGVSGKVKNPGCWELPMGTTIRELIEEHAGGMRDGFKLRGLIPGGGSTDFLTEEHLDLPMDFGTIQKAGSRMGTGTITVMDDKACPVAFTANLIKFFANESCGWCTPCREGLPWLARILYSIDRGEGQDSDMDILQQHTSTVWIGRTYCLLAPGAIEPLQSAIKYFRDDFDDHIKNKRCRWS